MKKLNFIIGILIVVLIVFTTGCEDEDAIGPSIVLISAQDYISTDATVTVQEPIQFIFEARKGDKNLDVITISEGNTAITGWNNKSIDNSVNDVYRDTVSITAPGVVGAYLYTFTVTDNGGLSASVSVNITVEPGDVNLSTPQDFTLVYKSSSQTDGENINDNIGIEYAENEDANTARFEVLATVGNVFVMLTESEANAITTQGELQTAYDDNEGQGVSSYTADSDALFTDKWFVTKVGENYYWVHMTDLTFAPGNNQAYFEYKN